MVSADLENIISLSLLLLLFTLVLHVHSFPRRLAIRTVKTSSHDPFLLGTHNISVPRRYLTTSRVYSPRSQPQLHGHEPATSSPTALEHQTTSQPILHNKAFILRLMLIDKVLNGNGA